MGRINDEFIANIPDNVNQAIEYFCDSFFEFDIPIPSGVGRGMVYENFIEYYLATQAYIKSKKFNFNMNIKLGLDKDTDIKLIKKYFTNLRNHVNKLLDEDKLITQMQKFDLLFGNTFSYQFTDGDLERIQILLNELRDEISKSEIFAAEHQARLLKRLERLQSELHKKVSDLDRFYGLIGDMGVMLGKLGNDAKPFVDRIRELTGIVWQTQSAAEELPRGTTIPLLRNPEEE